MPELDSDLVTWLTLGLLGLIVLCLLGVMSSIGRVRKAIERAAAQREREREDRWESPTSSVAATAEPEPAIERRPQPVAAREPEPQPSTYEATPAATASDGGSGVTATESSPAKSGGEEYAAQSTESSGTSSGAVSATQAASSTTTTTQSTEEPQEQPFERDGRWWFRRGSELLVYDEGTGQWVTAPEQSAPSPTATQPIPTTISSVSGTGESSTEASSDPQQGFWKCPSCGAVNGSTATSCRMCFTARP